MPPAAQKELLLQGLFFVLISGRFPVGFRTSRPSPKYVNKQLYSTSPLSANIAEIVKKRPSKSSQNQQKTSNKATNSASKAVSEITLKLYRFLARFWAPFGSPWLRLSPTFADFRRLWALLSPKRPRSSPWEAFWLEFGSNFGRFWLDLGSFWGCLGTDLAMLGFRPHCLLAWCKICPEASRPEGFRCWFLLGPPWLACPSVEGAAVPAQRFRYLS